jgi:hypothetical protein
VESIVVPEPRSGGEDKGLRKGALGFISSVTIGVASTAPGYSLASSLGLVVAAGVALAAPAIMILAFIPMLFVAAAYYRPACAVARSAPSCTSSRSPLRSSARMRRSRSTG